MPHAPTPLQRMRRTLVGDRAFYKMVLAIVVPILVQNAITNFVSLLDNVMVGRIGTDQMASVSIVNQLLFISNLCIFGGVSGAGLFAAQYYGAGNHEGVRHCFRFKLYLCIFVIAATSIVFCVYGDPLIMLFLNEDSNPARVAQALQYGRDYLSIMLWGFAPFALSQAYASTLRETGETNLPMRASIVAVFANLILNYILIYGHLGAPAMGVKGAALATVISRYAELAIVAYYTHRNPSKYPFIRGVYRSLRIPLSLTKQLIIKGMPLMLNEAFWSLGTTMITQCYSLRGLDSVSALNIANTVLNLFNVIFINMGGATAIIIGQVLGSGDTARAKDYSWKLIAFGMFCSVCTALLVAAVSPFVPLIYNTTGAIRTLATHLILAMACSLPIISFTNTCYFILRSGGKTWITFIFDSLYTWMFTLPLVYLLVTYTDMSIALLYLCVQPMDLLRCGIGFILVKKGVWIQNIVAE